MGFINQLSYLGGPHIVWCIIHFMDGFSMNESHFVGFPSDTSVALSPPSRGSNVPRGYWMLQQHLGGS